MGRIMCALRAHALKGLGGPRVVPGARGARIFSGNLERHAPLWPHSELLIGLHRGKHNVRDRSEQLHFVGTAVCAVGSGSQHIPSRLRLAAGRLNRPTDAERLS